jgi:hypothetical protein
VEIVSRNIEAEELVDRGRGAAKELIEAKELVEAEVLIEV